MAILDRDLLRALATETPDQPVLSVYLRTDPRDPANTNHTPAWEIELRNGLRAVSEKLDGDQTQQRSFEALRARVERELVALSPSEQGRSVAWFLQADGETSRRMTLQVPVRRDQVVWDDRPFVLPLVDVADRGAMTGVVLVGGDFVRLLQIADGNIDEPDDSTYELNLGDWRPYEAYASANPARAQQTVSHRERYQARVSEHRAARPRPPVCSDPPVRTSVRVTTAVMPQARCLADSCRRRSKLASRALGRAIDGDHRVTDQELQQ